MYRFGLVSNVQAARRHFVAAQSPGDRTSVRDPPLASLFLQLQHSYILRTVDERAAACNLWLQVQRTSLPGFVYTGGGFQFIAHWEIGRA